jgi:hypothetical protein
VDGEALPKITSGKGSSEREIDEGDLPLRKNRGRWAALVAALRGKEGRRKWLGRCEVRRGAAPASIYRRGEAAEWPGRARGPCAAGGEVDSALPATGRERQRRIYGGRDMVVLWTRPVRQECCAGARAGSCSGERRRDAGGGLRP